MAATAAMAEANFGTEIMAQAAFRGIKAESQELGSRM